MAEDKKCNRCGDRAMTIDNVVGSTFWGFIQTEVETVTTKQVHLKATYYVRNERDDKVMTVDEQQALCSDCWGLLIGRFMQGRSVPAMSGKEKW